MLSLNNKRNYVAVPETPSQFIPSQFSLVEGDIGVGGLLHGCNSKSSRLCKYSICSLKIEHAESLGGWHKVALEQFRNLGSALARHTGQGGRFPRYLVTNLVTNSSPNLVIHQIW